MVTHRNMGVCAAKFLIGGGDKGHSIASDTVRTHISSGGPKESVHVLNSLSISMCVALALSLSACTPRDDSFNSSVDPDVGTSGLVVDDDSGLSTDDNNDPTELALPTSVQPASISLSTIEETAVSSFFTVTGTSIDKAGDEPTYLIFSEPENGTLMHDAGSSVFTYTPSRDFVGIDTFEYGIADDRRATVSIEVANVADQPILFADIPRVVEQGDPFLYSLVVSDPDIDTHVFAAINLPAWLTLNTGTGELSGTPSRFDIGVFRGIEFTVTDSSGLRSTVADVSIEVIASNDAPFINIDQFPETLDAGQDITVNLFPDDSNGDPVSIASESNDLLGITVDGGVVRVIAAEVDQVTQVDMVLLVTDIRGGVTRNTVPLTLHPVNGTGRGRTLYGRGATGSGIHLVVLGDGYREEQQAQFRQHVETLVEKMKQDPGMNTHFSAWNVHMVETPSVDSGIDDNVEVDIRDTVFSTGYFCQSVRRLICGDQSAMFGVAIDEYPNYDQILVLVNDSRFGGSGGHIAISSTESIEIALHEMGHSIAGLADEYVDQYIPETRISAFIEGQFPNVSTNTDSTRVPWAHWLIDDDVLGSAVTASTVIEPVVGIFEGAFYRDTGFFRPTQDSLMRSYDGVLGPVNSEQWALSVYSEARPILDISPVNRLVSIPAGEAMRFWVEPTFDSSIQSVDWALDGRSIPDSGSQTPSVSLSFPPGNYHLAVTVRDISGLIRQPEPHDGVFNWDWTITVE